MESEKQSPFLRSESYQYPHEVILAEKITCQIKAEPQDEKPTNTEMNMNNISMQYDHVSSGEETGTDCDYESSLGSNQDTYGILDGEMGDFYIKESELTEEKHLKFDCDKCDKSFPFKFRLRNHYRVHSKDKPHKCHYCPKAFSLKSGLVAHIRTHTGEKPYSCDFCNKAFADFSTLKTHTRTHTGERPYGCDMCKKRFNNHGHLLRHKRIHSGERPFACMECNKTFGQETSLKTHMRIHTGAKPYVCDLCNAAFSHSSHVNRHKRRFHSKVLPVQS